MVARFSRVVLAASVLALLSDACSSSSSSSTKVESCQPGEGVACVSPSGCTGLKTCRPNGAGYSDCVCTTGSAGSGGTSAGASGSGGTNVGGANAGGASAGGASAGGATGGNSSQAGAGGAIDPNCIKCTDGLKQGYHGDEPGVSWCSGPNGALWSVYNCACATTGCGDVGATCDANWCEGHQVPTQECLDCIASACGSAYTACQLN